MPGFLESKLNGTSYNKCAQIIEILQSMYQTDIRLLNKSYQNPDVNTSETVIVSNDQWLITQKA